MKRAEAQRLQDRWAPPDSKLSLVVRQEVASSRRVLDGKGLGSLVEASWRSSGDTEADQEPLQNHKVGASAGLRERSGTSWK